MKKAHDIETAIEEAIKTYADLPAAKAAPLADSTPLQAFIDHTLLRPDATPQDISRLCQEAIANDFYAVCVASSFAKLARRKLGNSKVRLACVVGFPHGNGLTAAKLREARALRDLGCDEIDTVIHLGALRARRYDYILREWSALKRTFQGVVKVILETGALARDEKIAACTIARHAGVDFVKTCTGFLSGQATVEDVALMKAVVGGDLAVKASGGVRDRATALALLGAGATRIGASSSLNLVGDREKEGT